MTVTSHFYGQFIKTQVGGSATVNWATDPIKVMLTTVTYVPDQDTDQFRSSVTNEITGTGYTAGGVTLTGMSVSYDSTAHAARLIAGNASWTGATFTAHRAVVYKSTGSAATDPLIGWVDFGADQSPSGATFAVNFDPTNGAFADTVS